MSSCLDKPADLRKVIGQFARITLIVIPKNVTSKYPDMYYPFVLSVLLYFIRKRV